MAVDLIQPVKPRVMLVCALFLQLEFMGQDEVHGFLFPRPHLVGIPGSHVKVSLNQRNQPSEDAQLVNFVLDPVFCWAQFSL